MRNKPIEMTDKGTKIHIPSAKRETINPTIPAIKINQPIMNTKLNVNSLMALKISFLPDLRIYCTSNGKLVKRSKINIRTKLTYDNAMEINSLLKPLFKITPSM
jgi:hypothetical protein